MYQESSDLGSAASPSSTRCELVTELGEGGVTHWKISAQGAQAEISSLGATLISWKPQGQREVIFVSPAAQYVDGKAIRGGVPICWPWFSKHPTDPTQRNHGLVRDVLWDLVAQCETPEGMCLDFEPRASVELPDGVCVRYRVMVGKVLTLSLITENQSEVAFEYSEALHAYFAIGDLTQTRVRGLEGSRYVDTLAGFSEKTQSGVLDLEDVIDVAYQPKNDVIVIEDVVWDRRIRLQMRGADSLVVWNPGKANASFVSDLRAEDQKSFVCLEPGNVFQNTWCLSGQESHTLSVEIEVTDMGAD